MNTYSEKIKIKYSDIGSSNKLNIKSLIAYLQEVAGSHSNLVGYGLNDKPHTHAAWLLLDWKVQMFSHPHYDEEINIITWARLFKKFYSYRDFEIYDGNNNLIGLASSKWLLIDTDSRKLKHITNEVINLYGVNNKDVFKEKLNENPTIPEDLFLNFSYTIQRRDIDTNNHVNNLHYIDYALETLPENVYKSNEFNNIEIHYKKEIKYGDTIKCYYSFEKNKHIITIKSEDDNIIHSIITLY